MFMQRYSSIIRGLILCFSVTSTNISASEYSLGKSVNVRAYYADNSGLSTVNKVERYGETGALSFDLSRMTEISRFTGGLLLEVNNYNIKSYSTFDQRGNVDYTRNNERGSWGFGVTYDRDSISSYEDTEQNFNLQNQIDTQVLSQSLRANWNRQLDEKNVLALNASVTDVAYESAFRNDYRYGQSSLLWQHYLSDRMRLQANLSYSLFDSESTSSLSVSPLFNDAIIDGDLSVNDALFLIEACRAGFNLIDQISGGTLTPWQCFEELERDNLQTTLKLQLGIYYVWNENLTLDLLYGDSSVKSELEQTYINLPPLGGSEGQRVTSDTGEDGGATYQGSLNYSGERLQSTLSASRNESVNSNSVLSLNTRVGLDVQIRLNRYHALASGIEWYRQENSGFSGAEFYDRDISSVMLSYSYRISSYWSLRSVYRFKDLSQARKSAHGRGNEFHLSVKWSPAKTSWSR
jgi:hypothetical protein